jgi:predicted dehydrogenase
MTQPINLGIIGGGLAVQQLHWPALQRLPDQFRCVAVADINADTAAATAALVGADRVFTDYHDLLALNDVEAVLLSLPIHLTTPVTLDAARSGKHVLLEKPLGSNLHQARQLMQQLDHLPVIALVGENFRYRPDLLRARQLLDENSIGDPILITLHALSFVDTTVPDSFASTPWRHDIQYRGGHLLDGGVHHAAALRMLGGEIEWVQAFTKYGGSALNGPTTLSANLRFRSGALGSYLYSAVCHDDRSSFLDLSIYGTTGTLYMEENAIRILRPGQNGEERIAIEADGGYEGEFRNFYGAIRENMPVIATVEQSYRDMELILRAIDAAEQTQVILL